MVSDNDFPGGVLIALERTKYVRDALLLNFILFVLQVDLW
jgi:hypothetical protein